MEEKLTLTQEWDKTFPKSDKVDHSKVTFHNRYGITLAADLYVPKNTSSKLPAIAVCGPFGAVKEQAAGLYAQTMAERGIETPMAKLKREQEEEAAAQSARSEKKMDRETAQKEKELVQKRLAEARKRMAEKYGDEYTDSDSGKDQ